MSRLKNTGSITIVRVMERDGDYTTLMNTVAGIDTISWRAKGLYWYIMTLPDNWKIYKSELCTRSTEGYDAMNAAFNELIELGYISQHKTRDVNGKFTGWEYRVYENIDDRTNQSTPMKRTKPHVTDTGKCRSRQNPEVVKTNLIINKKENNTKEKTKEKQTPNNTTILPLDKVLEYFPQDWIDDKTFQSTMKDFHAHRREIKKPLRHMATKKLANGFKAANWDMDTAIENINKAIMSGWTGVVFPEDKAPQSGKKGNTTKKSVASGRSPRDIIEKHFTWVTGRYKGQLNKHASGPFLKDIYIPARDLLGGKDSPELTRQLLDMFEDMNDIKKKNIKPEERHLMPSTSVLMERYIEWLEDNNWITNRNVRLFDISHKLFSQFRREEARRYGYQQRDSLTGVSYVL